MEKVLLANRVRATRLPKSILKRAFEGRLVPQDLNDEPASVLLQRIRAERGGLDHGGTKRRGSGGCRGLDFSD